MQRNANEVIVAGGGPVGALNAIFLAKRGFRVGLYEARTDIRKDANAAGRSINLALSLRGLSALREAGVADRISAIGVPMHSRYVHLKNGTSYTIPYCRKGQYLLSTDRLELNRQLLSAAESCPNVELHLQHKLTKCDVETASATFMRADGSTVQKYGRVLFGCDGAYSAVRKQMLRGRMDYSQLYIPHGYKELCIPSAPNGDYKIPANYLHIWPRGEFMLIALPNLDKSFTCTLFMPFAKFEKLVTGEDVVNFFSETFKDALELIGPQLLKEQFFTFPPLPMVSIKCDPFHCGDTALIMGDAAHAIVPFYGQGLNAGLEDALIFDSLMEEFNCDFAQALPEFTRLRVDAAHAIADLSQMNYLEMRSHVVSRWFLFRRKIDVFLNRICPSFEPRYSMVAFTRQNYHEIIKKTKKQDMMVNSALLTLGGFALISSAWMAWKIQKGELNIPNFDRVATSIGNTPSRLLGRFGLIH